MNAPLPHLSKAEWSLMEVLWNESPLSASEVHERVDDEMNLKTVRALLDRILGKEAVSREKKHGVWVFRPAIKRDAFVLHESRTFLDRFFGGDPAPLFAQLVESEVLTPEKIERLQRLIAAESDDEKGGRDDH